MNQLTNELLLKAYDKALELSLNESFINQLEREIKYRNLINDLEVGKSIEISYTVNEECVCGKRKYGNKRIE